MRYVRRMESLIAAIVAVAFVVGYLSGKHDQRKATRELQERIGA